VIFFLFSISESSLSIITRYVFTLKFSFPSKLVSKSSVSSSCSFLDLFLFVTVLFVPILLFSKPAFSYVSYMDIERFSRTYSSNELYNFITVPMSISTRCNNLFAELNLFKIADQNDVITDVSRHCRLCNIPVASHFTVDFWDLSFWITCKADIISVQSTFRLWQASWRPDQRVSEGRFTETPLFSFDCKILQQLVEAEKKVRICCNKRKNEAASGQHSAAQEPTRLRLCAAQWAVRGSQSSGC